MKRIQLFEFEDFAWFPPAWRSTITKIIVVLHKLWGTREVVGDLLIDIQKRHPFTRIVDMGSGSGGTMPPVLEYLNEQQPQAPTELLLTDLHPNQAFVQNFNQQGHAHMRYQAESLDASNLTQAPEGLKTMMNSFHHMPPDTARKILATAQENKQPILIYEMGENKFPILVWALSTPIAFVILILMSMVMVFFVKPLTWKDLLFTWLIPVIPLFYFWDGHASLPRMYTFDDVKNHLLPPADEHYTWEMDQGKKPDGKTVGYYILGLPK
ncbi:MAG: hypothetical protein AAFR61_15415 [Bacteroidota bacterium]